MVLSQAAAHDHSFSFTPFEFASHLTNHGTVLKHEVDGDRCFVTGDSLLPCQHGSRQGSQEVMSEVYDVNEIFIVLLFCINVWVLDVVSLRSQGNQFEKDKTCHRDMNQLTTESTFQVSVSG